MLAATSAALACWLLLAPAATARLADRRSPRGGARTLGRWGFGGLPIIVVAAVTAIGFGTAGGSGAAVGFAGSLPLVTVIGVLRRHRARRTAARRALAVADACQLVAGLLRVGQVPTSALALAARDSPILAEAAAMQQIGGEVGPVLRRLGAEPGMAGLVELGVSWEVAERTGASLTATLDALADRLTASRAVADVVAAELSAPRATGRLLAVLPVAGLALGYGFGGDPFAFLTASLPGQLSLVAGVGLGCVGVFWTERISDSGDGFT